MTKIADMLDEYGKALIQRTMSHDPGRASRWGREAAAHRQQIENYVGIQVDAVRRARRLIQQVREAIKQAVEG